jgi:copper transport protein
VAAALLPQAASAHAQLVQSDPAPNAVVAAPPATVSLIFTEQVTPAGTGIKVFSPSGKQVAGPVVVRGSVLSASVGSTEEGTYVVSWQVLAADTHPSRGVFAFVVVRPSANPYSALLNVGEIGTTTPEGLSLQAVARFLHFAGFALAFGAVAYEVLTRSKQRARLLVGTGIVLLIAAEPMLLLAQLASLSFDGDTAIAVLASGFGRLLGLRLAAALMLWAIWKMEAAWPILALGGVIALLDGASAHAVPDAAAPGVVLVAIHVGAMGLWAGGLAAFLRAPDRRFTRYAAATFGIAALSGLVLALAHTGSLQALGTTEYGYVLMVKVLAVAVALGAVALRRQRLEAGMVVTIVALAALLASLPPPR